MALCSVASPVKRCYVKVKKEEREMPSSLIHMPWPACTDWIQLVCQCPGCLTITKAVKAD